MTNDSNSEPKVAPSTTCRLQSLRPVPEAIQWGIAGGIYTVAKAGSQRLRGADDWKNATVGGAVAGTGYALIDPTTRYDRRLVLKSTISGAFIALAGEILHHMVKNVRYKHWEIRTASMNHSSDLRLDTATAFDQAVQMATQCSKRNLTLKREDSKVEELVLKRCWLARYWGLAAKLGVYPHIAHKRHAQWAGFAPIPLEVVISAGQKAKALAAQRPIFRSPKSEKDKATNGTSGRASPSSPTMEKDTATDDGSGLAFPTCDRTSEEETPAECEEEKKDEQESSINDNQLLMADEGLNELAALRVEEAVLLKISQNQNPTLIWLGLSKEQAKDIQFKQAWLVHHWRRAQASGVVEQDIAMERLLYWMNQTDKPPSYEEAVNVQRGLLELRTCLSEIPSIESQPTEAQGKCGSN